MRVPLAALHPHPANPNVMSADLIATLARKIEQEGRYPPLIARPHPELAGDWQLLDGHNRCAAGPAASPRAARSPEAAVSAAAA